MKPMTLLLVAASFAAGLTAGLAGPLSQAGAGLAKMLASPAAPVAARLVHVTASLDLKREGFQPADFRWNAKTDLSAKPVCAPRDPAEHSVLPAIQHL